MIQKAVIITQELIKSQNNSCTAEKPVGIEAEEWRPQQGCLWIGTGFNTMDSMNYFKNMLTAYFGNKKKKLIETLGKVNKEVNT